MLENEDAFGGRTVSVYLRGMDVQNVREHARRKGKSFSWALRDLARKGWMAVLAAEEAKHMREIEEQWAIR